MDYLNAARDDTLARRKYDYAGKQADGLCLVDYLDQPRHDMGTRSRNLYALPSIEAERCRPVLESLLAPVAGRQTYELSKALLAEFGSLKAVLAARRSHLRRIIPDAEGIVLHIAEVARAFAYCLRLNVRPLGQNVSIEAIAEFLKFRIGFEPAEIFYALYFNRAGQLIQDGAVAEGALDSVSPSPRIIMRVALDIGAAGVVIAHNHPSSDPTPSRSDIALTREMITSFRVLKLHVYDHLVVCRHDVTSMRGQGLI